MADEIAFVFLGHIVSPAQSDPSALGFYLADRSLDERQAAELNHVWVAILHPPATLDPVHNDRDDFNPIATRDQNLSVAAIR